MNNTKRFTFKLYRFRVDEKFRPIGNAILTKIDCDTIGECMQVYRFLVNNNDVTKYTPYRFDEIIDNTESEEEYNA